MVHYDAKLVAGAVRVQSQEQREFSSDNPNHRPIVIEEGVLRSFCEKVFVKLGVPTDDARIAADVLVLADLRGVESQGVAHLSRYVNGLETGAMMAEDNSRIVAETDCVAVLDGGKSLGQVVGRRGMALAIDKAERNAIGVVSVRNSNHYGIAGYYSLMALEHELVGLSMTNTAPLVIPTFGRDAMLGTNPISFSAPAKKEKPFVLDMATSIVPRGKLEVHNRQNKTIPTGWAQDRHGKDIIDPKHALSVLAGRLPGGLLPLGGRGVALSGHKGYGLAVMVDILCGVLGGAATGTRVSLDRTQNDIGHFFLALNPASFRPLEEFKQDMDRFIRAIKDSPKAAGETRIYVHGEKSFAMMEQRRKHGIPLEMQTAETLGRIGEKLGIEWMRDFLDNPPRGQLRDRKTGPR